MSGRQTLFVCDDYLFSHKRPPADSLRLARAAPATYDLTILSNHYWMFYHPWRAQPNPPDLAAWNALLDDLLGAPDYEISSFSAFAKDTDTK